MMMVEIFFQALLVGGGLFWLFGHIFKRGKRWGGAVIIVVFISLILFHRELELTRPLQGILWGSLLILLFGLWDDKKNLSWKAQFVFQCFLVILLLLFGFEISHFRILNNYTVPLDGFKLFGLSVLSVAFIFLWIITSINAVNWLDGADSLLGTVALVGGLSLFTVSLLPEVNQPAMAIVAIIFLGAIVSFLIFNFPPAKVEAGTSGSYFVGFVLASLAIMAGSKIITVMIVLLLPLVDFVWVIINRRLRGVSIFKKEQCHLHHRLIGLGWGNWKIFLFYSLFLSSVFAGYFILNNRQDRLLLFVGEIIVLIIFLWIINKKQKNNQNENV